MTSPLLEMRGISKRFPGVLALDEVSFDLQAGELHALVGENGAGKSTLMKVLGGVYPHGTFGGEIRVNGEPVRFTDVRQAERAGIAVVHQELSLVPEFSIAENIFLGREPRRFGIIRTEELYSSAQTLLENLHLKLDPRMPVRYLGIGQQHLVEIAKALSRDARILILDEPTAALTDSEASVLFRILRRLRENGSGIAYISHKLGEVFELSDRITVLRDGRTVSTDPTVSLDVPRVIARMVGRDVGELFTTMRRPAPRQVVFEARSLTVEDPGLSGKLLVDDAGFSVRAGEVLGIAGLIGAGRTDLMMALFGAHPGRKSGRFLIDGNPVRINHPSDAIAAGIGFVTEDRKRYGLFPDQSIGDNLTVAALKEISGVLVTDLDAETAAGERSMKQMRIKARSLLTIVGTLSGGNQQKVVLARWMLTSPKILLLDEPTRGIDVGAKQEIYAQIDRLASEGLAIVLVSSELPEVLGLSDRILVLHEGRITAEFLSREVTPEQIMACATGQFVDQVSA